MASGAAPMGAANSLDLKIAAPGATPEQVIPILSWRHAHIVLASSRVMPVIPISSRVIPVSSRRSALPALSSTYLNPKP